MLPPYVRVISSNTTGIILLMIQKVIKTFSKYIYIYEYVFFFFFFFGKGGGGGGAGACKG